MDATDVWVLGGHQTDFARHLTREGLGFRDLTREVALGTLEAAGVPAEAVEVVHVGNAFGEAFTGQGHLGAMPATVVDGLWGKPASRHEGACASGSLAVLAAVADLRSGAYDCALVLGVELEKTVPSAEGARLLGGAALLPDELDGVTFPWPEQFSRVADEYDARYGLDDAHLRRIAQVNLEAARRNPRAQTRGWSVPDDLADEATNPVVSGRLRRFDCSQVTDGGAGVVLVTDAWRRAHPEIRPLARIEGWGHRVVGLPLEPKLARSRAGGEGGSPYVMPHVRRAVTDALGRAGTDLEGLAGYEVHDCFAPSEYLAIDHLGLTGPGESWKAVENGDIELGGSFPINPSGGLIGGGHPVGATGVRMLLDATRQVSGTADDYQVEGAQRFGTLN
ncbi:acetyl-CoA acetyltransferase, partial [Lapillicoccus jejuensis]